MKEIQQLRRIAVRLGVSGTAIPIAETRLYKGGYGFVVLQCYVPVTQNRSPATSPLCTVFRTTIDKFGNRKQFNNDIYNMLYVDDAEIENAKYMVFETPLPKAFTDTVGELELVFTYSEVDSNNKAATRLASGIYKTTVGDSDVSSGDTIDPTGGELARLNELTIKTENMPNLVADIQKSSGNSFTYTDNKGITSEPITLGVVDYNPTYVGAASVIELPASTWQPIYSGTAITGYTVTITAAQHGQMRDGVTAADLSVSFKRGDDELVTSPMKYTNYNASYTIYPSGNIVLTSNMLVPFSIVATIWNGKGLADVTARESIAAETTRAEAAETQLQANINSETDRAENAEQDLQKQIDEITQSGVDLTARADIAAETARAESTEAQLQSNIAAEIARAEIAEAQLQSDIAAERARAESAEQTLQHNIDVNTSDIDGLREDITNESHFRGMFDSVAALKEAYPTATPNDYAYIVGGNIYIWQNNEWTDSNEPSPNTAVPKGTATPLMDGVAQVGNSNTYADALHRHPTDTTKVNKTGDEMSGPLTLPLLLGSGATDARGIIPVKYIPRTDLGFSQSTSDDAYLQAWLKKVCELYPNRSDCVFIGAGNPSSKAIIQALIYNTSEVNESGMPRYVIGISRRHETVLLQFGVNNYVYRSQTIFNSAANINIAQSSGNVSVGVERTDTGSHIGLDIGSGGTNRGLFDKNTSINHWIVYWDNNNLYLVPPSSSGKVYINGVNPLTRKAWTYNTNATKSSTGGMIEGTAYTFSGIFGIGGVPPQALGGLITCSNVFGYIINQTTFISLKTVQATISAGDPVNIYGFEVGE